MSYFPNIRDYIDTARKLNHELLRYNHSRAVQRLLAKQGECLLSAALISAETIDADTNNASVTWFDVSVELPDAMMNVLVAIDDGEVDAAFYNGDGTWTWLDGHDVTKPVIAWADMPQYIVKTTTEGEVS